MSADVASRQPDTAEASVLSLVRDDLRDFAGYRSARREGVEGRVWLNANESPWGNAADSTATLHRYPDPQPPALRAALARLYGCRVEQLLVGRGSDEGIDLLVRALCRPGNDAVVVTSPTFGMYAVNARLHGVEVIDVALRDGAEDFKVDFDGIAEAVETRAARVVFLCSPGNPSGTLLPLVDILGLARRLQGKAVVVVDEAYVEFAQGPSAVAAIDSHENLAVLRTLSKAHALAAARVGCVIATPALIAVLQRCQAPYPLPAPCVALAERAVDASAQALTVARIAELQRERGRMHAALSASSGVRRVYRSQANFLLVRFEQPQSAYARLLAAGIVVRDLRHLPRLGDALRISLGTREQNDAVLDALDIRPVAA